MSTATTRQYRDTRIDVRLMLTALWTATLFVFAYVDILGFYRDDVLEAAMNGRVAGTSVAVDQTFLTLTLAYVLLPALMVVLSLVLPPRANRIVNLGVSLLYAISIAATCIGETQPYYLLGSTIEAILLLVIARAAWKWPATEQ